jgi:hypothetical protein
MSLNQQVLRVNIQIADNESILVSHQDTIAGAFISPESQQPGVRGGRPGEELDER